MATPSVKSLLTGESTLQSRLSNKEAHSNAIDSGGSRYEDEERLQNSTQKASKISKWLRAWVRQPYRAGPKAAEAGSTRTLEDLFGIAPKVQVSVLALGHLRGRFSQALSPACRAIRLMGDLTRKYFIYAKCQ